MDIHRVSPLTRNQDDYSTKSDKKKLTGLTVSLFNIFQKNYSSAGFIKL